MSVSVPTTGCPTARARCNVEDTNFSYGCRKLYIPAKDATIKNAVENTYCHGQILPNEQVGGRNCRPGSQACWTWSNSELGILPDMLLSNDLSQGSGRAIKVTNLSLQELSRFMKVIEDLEIAFDGDITKLVDLVNIVNDNSSAIKNNTTSITNIQNGVNNVTKIVAGSTNVTVTPAVGTGVVTIDAVGGGGGGAVESVTAAGPTEMLINPTTGNVVIDVRPIEAKITAAEGAIADIIAGTGTVKQLIAGNNIFLSSSNPSVPGQGIVTVNAEVPVKSVQTGTGGTYINVTTDANGAVSINSEPLDTKISITDTEINNLKGGTNLEAGTGITLSKTADKTTINNAGVTKVTGNGNTVTVTPVGGTGDVVVDSTLVDGAITQVTGTLTKLKQGDFLTNGPGILIENITNPNSESGKISNTGILNVTGGSGIGVSITTQEAIVTNNGVLQIVAGAGISVDQPSGIVTVSVSGGGGILPAGVNLNDYLVWNPSAAGSAAWTVGGDKIHLGKNAAATGQKIEAVAIGTTAGNATQGEYSIAIGFEAGKTNQGDKSIAFGFQAGASSQPAGTFYVSTDSVREASSTKSLYYNPTTGEISSGPVPGGALPNGTVVNDYLRWNGVDSWVAGVVNQSIGIGENAGLTSQEVSCVAIGQDAGKTTQRNKAVAIGLQAGASDQQASSIAIGEQAGNTTQGAGAIAIGLASGLVNQGESSIAMGINAGASVQKNDAVAIGTNSGASDQGVSSVAVGRGAGQGAQGNNSVAIGVSAGSSGQSTNSVAIGIDAARGGQGISAVAIGNAAAVSIQGTDAIAIGRRAGGSNQSDFAIAMGASAGRDTQGLRSIAVGSSAGYTNQGDGGIAVGYTAGETGQLANAVAIGREAGRTNQKVQAIAIGYGAGNTEQGTNSIAIGKEAGSANQLETAIAIGDAAAAQRQAARGIAIGYEAGKFDQAEQGIAIGFQAGFSGQASNAIAIGTQTSSASQKPGSVAIGYQCCQQGGANSIAMGTMLGVIQGDSAITLGSIPGIPLTIPNNSTHFSRDSLRYTDGTPLNVGGSYVPQGSAVVQPLAYNNTTGEICLVPTNAEPFRIFFPSNLESDTSTGGSVVTSEILKQAFANNHPYMCVVDQDGEYSIIQFRGFTGTKRLYVVSRNWNVTRIPSAVVTIQDTMTLEMKFNKYGSGTTTYNLTYSPGVNRAISPPGGAVKGMDPSDTAIDTGLNVSAGDNFEVVASYSSIIVAGSAAITYYYGDPNIVLRLG